MFSERFLDFGGDSSRGPETAPLPQVIYPPDPLDSRPNFIERSPALFRTRKLSQRAIIIDRLGLTTACSWALPPRNSSRHRRRNVLGEMWWRWIPLPSNTFACAAGSARRSASILPVPEHEPWTPLSPPVICTTRSTPWTSTGRRNDVGRPTWPFLCRGDKQLLRWLLPVVGETTNFRNLLIDNNK